MNIKGPLLKKPVPNLYNLSSASFFTEFEYSRTLHYVPYITVLILIRFVNFNSSLEIHLFLIIIHTSQS